MQRDLPEYIERGGDLVVRQPLELCGVLIHSFVLSADRGRLAALVARLLNAPAEGAVGCMVRPARAWSPARGLGG